MSNELVKQELIKAKIRIRKLEEAFVYLLDVLDNREDNSVIFRSVKSFYQNQEDMFDEEESNVFNVNKP